MNNVKEWILTTVITANGSFSSKRESLVDKKVIDEVTSLTPFIPNRNLKASCYAILQGISSLPLCVTCNKELEINPVKIGNEYFLTRNKYCSKHCAQFSLEAKEKREKTTKDRYGASNIFATEIGKEKIRTTNLEKYGSENPQGNSEIRAKTLNTLKENYGGIGMQSPIIRSRIVDTNKKTTGYNTPFESPKVQENIKSKIKLEGKTYKEKFISPETISKLNDIKWIVDQNYRYKKSIVQIAKELDVTPSAIYYRLKLAGVQCNEEIHVSIGQRELQDFIKGLGIEILTNNRSVLKNRELDIYIPELNLAIEYNGNFWHSKLSGKDKKYHIEKTLRCEELGIQLIQILSSEWELKKDIVKSIIRSKLNSLDTVIFARKCVIREVSNKDSREFLTYNHLQGAKNSKVRLGLYFEDTLVSLMTFSNRQKDFDWELDRFCNKLNTKVVGGAGKLFKYFRDNYSGTVLTYADRRYSTGDLYEKLGFKLSHASSPNFFYTKDYVTLESRLKYQKHKLESILENYDPNLTEMDNMIKHGFDVIFDSGNLVFTYSSK